MKARLINIINSSIYNNVPFDCLVADFSLFIDAVKEKNPDLANQFLKRQYELIYGRHFNKECANEEVSYMHHEDEQGEVITIEEVRKYHRDEITEWDAYVAYNYTIHNLSDIDICRETKIEIAEKEWFEDENFNPSSEKVWEYFSFK